MGRREFLRCTPPPLPTGRCRRWAPARAWGKLVHWQQQSSRRAAWAFAMVLNALRQPQGLELCAKAFSCSMDWRELRQRFLYPACSFKSNAVAASSLLGR